MKGVERVMLIGLSSIFPCNDIERTSDFYVNKLEFKAVSYLNSSEPHICLYKDSVEIILIKALAETYKPNHVLYGYGFDVYFYTENQEKLEQEFKGNGVKFVKPLCTTDYNNKEFVIEDCDGRYIAFGCKLNN